MNQKPTRKQLHIKLPDIKQSPEKPERLKLPERWSKPNNETDEAKLFIDSRTTANVQNVQSVPNTISRPKRSTPIKKHKISVNAKSEISNSISINQLIETTLPARQGYLYTI